MTPQPEQIVKQNSGKANTDVSDPTNNREELTAIKMILKDELAMKLTTIYSDSEYSINSITKWYKNWQLNGWKTAAGTNVKNRDLIEEIIQLKNNLNVNFQHVYSHTGNKYNEIVDGLARQAAMNP